MNERGNVLFYILIAVALLAALIFAVGQSGRGSIGAVNEEKARILASEIIDYSNTVATAYAQLRLRGCKFAETSFENTVDANYTNPSAPADKTCHVFELAGGGVTFRLPPAEALETAPGKQLMTTGIEIDQVGTTCAANGCTELLMVTGPLKKAICDEINVRLKNTGKGDTTPNDSAQFNSMDEFIGQTNYIFTIGDDSSATALSQKTAACTQDADDNTYHFYKVLVAN